MDSRYATFKTKKKNQLKETMVYIDCGNDR